MVILLHGNFIEMSCGTYVAVTVIYILCDYGVVIVKLLAAPEKEKKRFGLDGRNSSHFRYTNMGGDREGKEALLGAMHACPSRGPCRGGALCRAL